MGSMKRWRRRLAVLLLALAALLACVPPAGQAYLTDVYLTAVNNQVLEMDSATMPFRSGGVWYVSSRPRLHPAPSSGKGPRGGPSCSSRCGWRPLGEGRQG